MNYAYETAYYDLCGIAYLMRIKGNERFSQVIVYPFARDVCLIIYQINKELFQNKYQLNTNVKKIRHRVKSYSKGQNVMVFQGILQKSIRQFGHDIDNIGLYLDGDSLVGSTIFSNYIFLDTDILKDHPRDSQKSAFKFYTYMGETVGEFAGILEENIESINPIFDISSIKYEDNTIYRMKDIHHMELFKENEAENAFITRILLILQEITACLWLYDLINKADINLTLDKYITLRLLSIKADEIRDNLVNMKLFVSDSFYKYDKLSGFQLTSILDYYEHHFYQECNKLRNFSHYNHQEDNFLSFVSRRINENPNYVTEILTELNNNFMFPLSKVLSGFFNIQSMKSMSYAEKLIRRIKSTIMNRR